MLALRFFSGQRVRLEFANDYARVWLEKPITRSRNTRREHARGFPGERANVAVERTLCLSSLSCGPICFSLIDISEKFGTKR